MTTKPSPDSRLAHPAILWCLGLLAIVAPTLVAAHAPPSVTFFNQALAVLGWGVFIAVLGRQPEARTGRTHPMSTAMMALSSVFLIHAALAFGSAFLWGDLPGGLGLMGGGMSLAGWLALRAGWRSGQSPHREWVLDVFFGSLVLAGVMGMVLALIQVFIPQLADGNVIAAPTMAGRAVGNLRQPNHFSTLLVWSCCSATWLGARGRLRPWQAALLVALFIMGIVLTASRTGMVGMVFLALWGLLDKGLPRALRLTLIGAPLIYGACWGGMWLLSQTDKNVAFAAEARLHDHSDISSSRFKIWANVLELIRLHPWFGVGYGEFNVAWTFTPFPTRPVAFFDHTHNIVLQWVVELGIPVALLLSGMCMWAFVAMLRPHPGRQAAKDNTALATMGACAVIVAIAALHSLLEYPLWYSYFLLPTAFAWGLGLGVKGPWSARPREGAHRGRAMVGAGALMAAMAIWCALDFLSAVNIYAPWPGAGPLNQRIAFGMKMPWWGYQADYAEVTSGDDDEPSKPPKAFRRTLHNLLDARLMVAYARSLAEHGEVDKARFVVERLKEFRNPVGDGFLATCKEEPEPGDDLPFQCAPPRRSYSWRELLPS
jgi:O-antigen ligase